MDRLLASITHCVVALLASVPAASALAQVGHTPAQSPFRDLAYKQHLSAFTGYYFGNTGDAGVAPGGGPAFGVRYEIRVGGPAQFAARVLSVLSEREVKDPAKADAERDLGTRAWPLYIADAGLTLNLTGQKSFHHLVPILSAGIGVASDRGKGQDIGGFSFGTPFAFSFGAGVRWARGGKLEARMDVADYIYQLSYPDSYLSAAPGTGNTPILRAGASTNQWTHNPLFSIGISYLFAR